MTIRRRFFLVAVLALAAAGILLPPGARAGRPYDASINNEKAQLFTGKVVSVDPSGTSISVRGADGFKTFRTLPNSVKGVSAGDSVSISFLPDSGGPKVVSLSVTEKAQGASEAERLRAQREEQRKNADAQKDARNAKNRPDTSTVNDDLGYGHGYYVPPDQR